MNEISFVSWGGGDVAYINPFQHGRGPELKRQLVRAGLVAAKAFRSNCRVHGWCGLSLSSTSLATPQNR